MQQGCADCQAPFLKDELERVIHDIVHHLRNAVAVGAHQAGLGAKIDLYVERFFLNVVHPADEDAADEFVEVKIAQGQLVHALVHAAQLQKVGDETLHAVGLVKDDLQITRIFLLRDGTVQHALHKAVDAGHG